MTKPVSANSSPNWSGRSHMKQMGLFSGVPVKTVKGTLQITSPPMKKPVHDVSNLNGMYYEESTGLHVSYVLGLRYWEGTVTDADPEWKKRIRLERSIKDGPKVYHENATRYSPPNDSVAVTGGISDANEEIVPRYQNPEEHPDTALF